FRRRKQTCQSTHDDEHHRYQSQPPVRLQIMQDSTKVLHGIISLSLGLSHPVLVVRCVPFSPEYRLQSVRGFQPTTKRTLHPQRGLVKQAGEKALSPSGKAGIFERDFSGSRRESAGRASCPPPGPSGQKPP